MAKPLLFSRLTRKQHSNMLIKFPAKNGIAWCSISVYAERVGVVKKRYPHRIGNG